MYLLRFNITDVPFHYKFRMSKTYHNLKLLTVRKELQEPKMRWSLKSSETHTDILILYE